MSYLGKDRHDGLPKLNGHRSMDRNLTLLEDEIERLRFSRSAPPAGRSSSRPNSPGLGLGSPQPSGFQTKKMIQDLHDQVKLYKSELDKKDKLIQDLSRVESSTPYRRVHFSPEDKYSTIYPTEVISSHDHTSDSLRQDVSILQLKNDQLKSEVRDYQSRITSRDEQIDELKVEVNKYRESSDRNAALVLTLQGRIQELKDKNDISVRGEFTIGSLQKENNNLQEKILELERRIRNLIEGREGAERKLESWDRQFHSMFLQLKDVASVEDRTPEYMTSKINEVVQENLTLRGKVSTLSEALSNLELESKAGRETIQRLAEEISREQKQSTSSLSSVEKMRLEKNSAIQAKTELERENKLLRERFNADKKAWELTREELKQRESRLAEYGHTKSTLEFEAQVAKAELKSLKESLAAVLSCEPTEEIIRSHIKKIHANTTERQSFIDVLEAKVKSLTEQLHNQVDLHHSTIKRAREAEDNLGDFKVRIRTMEDGLNTGEVLKDTLRAERKKYMAFIEKMCRVLNMDVIALDVGFDLCTDAVLARAEQVMRKEADTITDKTTHVYNLQRKLKTMKQQVESKDLHIDLLRKKICTQEDSLHGRSALEKEKDDIFMGKKKLEKENDRLRGQLGSARQAIAMLKAKLMDIGEVKVENMAQGDQIEALCKELTKLEKTKERQARKIAGMKNEIEFTEHEAHEKKSHAERSVTALVEELRATKALLIDIQKRERQLLDFRQVVARMLSLDVTVLAVPDYEIITRLEKLIQAHHSHSLTTHSLERSIGQMERGFREGYEDAQAILNTPRRSRTRSLSPSRRRNIHQVQTY
ncbi:coiled-coil domain-containing protein 170-like [Anneissia japonica]|uniref:coiled-coil domain-containing protein 170-like n=1 Tax=Anneissia japonica TaxID=1529436 RepID=UPI0014258F3B|nr:coiled-coil domain-containing protein 170-like [Anneissia japonica]